MEDWTVWYGFHLLNEADMEIINHLMMNGYTFYTNRKDIIFVYSEEAAYVLTILKDHKIAYDIL